MSACRLFVASEALLHEYGGISLVSRATVVARRTIGAGMTELRQIEEAGRPVGQCAHAKAQRRPQEDDGEGPLLAAGSAGTCRRDDASRSRLAAVVDGPQPTQSGPSDRPVCVFLRSEDSRFRSQSAWVDHSASHPLWSAAATYYTPTGTNPLVRSFQAEHHRHARSDQLKGDERASA